MNGSETLLKPADCVMLLVDLQAGLGFGTESISRQVLLNNAVALAKTAAAFGVPVIATTSASKVYSGPLFPQVQAALPDVKAIERRNMNAWEDDTAHGSVQATSRNDFWWLVC
jgi:nicotinamidase-related amidase